MTDSNLERFVIAQQSTFDEALRELESARKKTHWMWFVFPQLDGLGTSDTARKYSIKSADEAREYLGHPVLGSRLEKCIEVLLSLDGMAATEIFSHPDDLKLRSSMTLFSMVAGEKSLFQTVLDKYFLGGVDERTIEILERSDLKKQPLNTVPVIAESLAFRVFAERVTKERKDKCGDSFVACYFDKEQLLLLAIADGVSSSPCDWKASEVACEALVERFKVADGSVAQRMANAASKAHNSVRQIDGRCTGSITSLTFVVWAVTSNEVHVLNVGDSRAYLGPDNDLNQITSDDVQLVILKRNGEVVLQAGVPVFLRGVTRSLGQTEPLDFSVQTHSFQSNDLLLLVSDGISKNEAFTSEFPKIFSSTNISQELSKLVAESSPRNKDDATLVAVWRKPTNNLESERRLTDCIKNNADFRNEGLTPIQVAESLQTTLLEQIKEEKNQLVGKILDYSDHFGIRFHRDFLSALLSHVICQGTDRQLVARLRDLIRKSLR